MIRAASSSAFSWKPKGVSRTMASSRGSLTRAIRSWWTDVITGLVSPEPKMAISRGRRARGPATPRMLPPAAAKKPPLGEASSMRPVRSGCFGAASPGHHPDQGNNSPADQRVDGDCDQRLGLQDRASLDGGVEDAVEGRHQRLGDVVHEGHEAGHGRAAE